MADFLTTAEKYGARYNNLLANTLDDIEREIRLLIRPIQRGQIAAQERMAYLMQNRLAIIERIRNSTISNFDEATQGAYKSAFNASETFYKQAGVSVPFLETDLDAFKLVRQSGLEQMVTHANLDANNIFMSLTRYSLTGNEAALNRTLLQNMDSLRIARYGKTIVDTNVSSFYRTISGTKAVRAGVEEFDYLGPSPERSFCIEKYGKRFTMEQITFMDNGQAGTGDVFFACGGWNCKHRWGPNLDKFRMR